ncbi:MAG: FGGY-family carbohydrate kinase, partial [Anaerolineae bacterium]
MTKQYILAHDLGTTGNKASLFDAEGRAQASAFAGYETTYPGSNWAEQDPGDWWQAVRDSSRELLAKADVPADEIAAIGFSGQMMGCLPVDERGNPLRSSIIWADMRAVAEAQFLAEKCGADEIYRRTGHRAVASYSAAKILWVKNHQPDIYAKTHKFLQAKDYSVYKLTGRFATDCSDASGTNLLDLDEMRWAPDVLEAVGIDGDLLPAPLPSSTVVGELTSRAAEETGLAPGTPVVIGGGDGACATTGAGVVDEGDAYNYIGSSSWISIVTRQPIYDPKQRTFTFVCLDPEFFFPTGTMQAAGGSYGWLECVLRGEEEEERLYQTMDTEAEAVEPGAGGLIFLPYLIGERSPHWNPKARGAF